MAKFQDYLAQLPAKRPPSEVKRKILTRLWDDDDTPFPKPWVSSAELLELTGQKYFDRRTRELRDQLGCDIETTYSQQFSGHAWRLKSDNVSPPQDRDYLSESQKQKLFSAFNYTCAVCGNQIPPGVRGLQADHKVPLSRGGGNDFSNWQALCHNCNIGKRRACANCDLACATCSWAHPDRNGVATMVNIHESNLRKLESMAIKEDTSISAVINQAIKKF